jgi:uncharacterized sulfatase
MKWLLRIAVILAIAAGIAWFYRIELMLEGIGVAVKIRTPVGPHREIEWSTGPAQPVSPPAERPPNIVLIVADDLGWNDLTFGGGGVAGGSVPTPHIDSIAADGVQFTNGYSSSGTCAPSRAALMSGRYPTRFGFEFTPTPPMMLPMVARMANEAAEKTSRRKVITYFDQPDRRALPFEEMGVPASEITLAETLKSAGYHTAHIGKWHLGYANGMAPHDQGFDESLLMASGLYLREDDPDVVNSKQDFDPIDRFLWKGLQFAASFNGSEYFEPGGYLTDYYTDEAVRVIDANAHRPLFLYLAHWAPHTPLQATKADYDALSHIEDHTLRVYAAMIRALDRSVGRVLQALRANGLERGEHPRHLHLGQRRRPLHRAVRDQSALPRLEDQPLRGRYPRTLLHALAGANRCRLPVRGARPPLRRLRNRRGSGGGVPALRPEDGRGGSRSVRAR